MSQSPPTESPRAEKQPTEEEFLRQAGEIWAEQTPDETDNRWRRVDPDVELYEEDKDTGGGTGVVRVARSGDATLERQQQGYLRATVRAERPPEGMGRVLADLRTVLLGAPLASARMSHERLSKFKALAVLSSDALSSVSYATEQTLAVLLVGGVAALALSPAIGAAIVVLLLLVGLSYSQTIRAYPKGGGSYIVASDNLSHVPGLIAGPALMPDYILTVAVSV